MSIPSSHTKDRPMPTRLSLLLSDPAFSFNVYIEEKLWECYEEEVAKTALKFSGTDSSNTLLNYFKLIEDEFVELSGIRKNTVLNTNVIDKVSERVFSDNSIVSYYFEIFQTFTYKLSMDLGEDGKDECLRRILKACSSTPFSLESIDHRDQDAVKYKMLADTMGKSNNIENLMMTRMQWYFIVILSVFFYSTILENMVQLKKVEPT